MNEHTRTRDCDACILEQYKVYITDLGGIGTRHAATNTIYISILSALIVFLSLTGGEKSALGPTAFAAQIAVGLTGSFLCIAWFAHIKSFGYLYKAKFDVLRELEHEGRLYACYKREADLLNPKAARFTFLESITALLLLVPFIAVVAFSAWKWAHA